MPLGNPIRKQNESRMVSVLATEGQTVFTVQGGYIINHISVFRNGVRLSPAEDFTAGDGSTVTLNDAANIDDRIDFHIFDRFTVQNAIVGAASTQTINGDLVLNGKLFGQLDVPSINLTGIITATELDLNGKADISSDLNVAGVSTFKDDVEFHGVNGISSITFDKSANNLVFKDNAKAAFGDASDLIVFHDGTLSKIQNSSSGQLEIISNDIDLRSSTGDSQYFTAQVGGAATVFYDNSVRIATSPSGVDVTGTLNVTGITTVQAFQATTGTFTDDVSVAGDFQVPDVIKHQGDVNTKIRFPGNDTFTVETGGSERVRVNDTGMGVGITPVRALNVVVGSGTTELIRLSQTVDASVQQEFGIGWCSNNNHGHPGAQITSLEYDVSDTRRGMLFYTRGTNQDIAPTERMRITHDGNVGIGSDNPDVKLTVFASSGDSYIRTIGGTNQGLLINKSDGTLIGGFVSGGTVGGSVNDISIRAESGNNITFAHGTTERCRIDSSGNFGLGTATPASLLELKGSSPRITLTDTNGSDDVGKIFSYAGALMLQQRDGSSHGEIIFRTENNSSATERMRITSGGDVRLNGGALVGDDTALPTFTIKNTDGNSNNCKITLGESVGADNGGITFYTAGSSTSTARMRIRGNNNFIDILSSYTLRFNDGKLNISHDGSHGYVTATTGILHLRSDSSIRLQDESGNPMLYAIDGGSVELYENGNKICETTSSGFSVIDGTGSNAEIRVTATGTNRADLMTLATGTGDANLWLDASNGDLSGADYAVIKHNNADLDLEIVNYANDVILKTRNGSLGGGGLNTSIHCHQNGAVDLYHDNTKQVYTHPNGIFTRGIYPQSDNTFSIGSGSERFHTVYATQGINTSDRAEKNTIIESDLGLDFVNKLKPVSYKWNEDDGKTHYGLIAQDVEETVIDIGKTVSDFGAIDKPDGDPMGLSYNEFISPLIKAVQELSAKIETLEAKVAALEGS